jgi:hypothetical protein
MKPALKVGVVTAGYLAAFLIAAAAVAIRLSETSGPDAQAAGGMYAFGDLALFVAVFGLAGLLPTGAALFFLRPYRPFWVAISGVGVLVALIGVAAAILFAFGRASPATSTIGMMAGLSVLAILASPLLALAFFVAALLSPHNAPRRALLSAALLEAAIVVYAGYIWFSHSSPAQ